MTRNNLLNSNLLMLLGTAILSLSLAMNQVERNAPWWATIVFSFLIIAGCVLTWFYARVGLRFLIGVCLAVQITACVLCWYQFGSLANARMMAFTFGNLVIIFGLISNLLSVKEK
jgi:hypothetical protein